MHLRSLARRFLAPLAALCGLAGLAGSAAAQASPFTLRFDGDGPALAVEVTTDAAALPVEDVMLGGRVFQRIDVGEGLNYDDVALPDLPTLHRLVAVEPDLYYEVRVELADPVVMEGVLLAPVQPDAPDTGVRAPFRMNEELYQTDMDVGSETVVLGEKVRIGGIAVLPLKITPAHYNPAQRRLTVWQRVHARLVPLGPDPAAAAQPRAPVHGLTSFQYSQLRNLVENVDTQLPRLGRVDVDTVLVVTTPDLADAARSLMARAASAGVAYELRQIQPGLPSLQLRDLIRARYAAGGLDSVLLFGDEAQIQMHEWSRGVWGDSFYSYVDGNDWLSDIGVARLPVSDAAEAAVLVAKLERYAALKRAGHVNKNVLLIAHKEEFPQKYTGNMERVRTAPNPRRLSFSTLYGGTGAVNESVIDAVARDAGFAIVAYRGHGTADTWIGWDAQGSSFGAAETARLANDGERLAVFLDLACSNAALQSTTPSLAEMQLFHEHGAVAVLGATMLSATTTNNKYNEYLFSYMQTDANLRLGSINALANNRIVRDNGGNIVNNVKMYLLLADPTIEPWIR